MIYESQRIINKYFIYTSKDKQSNLFSHCYVYRIKPKTAFALFIAISKKMNPEMPFDFQNQKRNESLTNIFDTLLMCQHVQKA